MQRSVSVLLLLAVVVVAAFFVFKRDESTEDEPGLEPTNGGTTTPSDDGGGSGLKRATGKIGPAPPLEPRQLGGGEGRLLMIGRTRATWTATLEITFHEIRNLKYRTWYMFDPKTQGVGGEFAGKGRGLSELLARPTASYLEGNDILVLVLDQVDPNVFPDTFWSTVAERVNSGRMGLYFRPGPPMDDANKMLSAHPALSHPGLGALLPVEKAMAIEGNPVPGVFATQQPLGVTPEGLQHPATRLTEEEEHSRVYWARASQGEGAVGTKFVYPVTDLKAGAKVLVNVEAAVSTPGIVVGGGPGRVLWMGMNDFGGRKTHFTLDKNRFQKAVLNRCWLWLMGD